jgi:hypothetical protein
MKVIRKRPYNCADFLLVRSCGYQNKLILGEMKPITSNSKQAIISRNKTFSNSTIVFLQMSIKFKIGHFKIKEEELDRNGHLYRKPAELKKHQ